MQDAHEFLTSVLDQMRCLSPQLQMRAASMGRVYSCPVEDNMVFKIQKTRTCKRYNYTITNAFGLPTFLKTITGIKPCR